MVSKLGIISAIVFIIALNVAATVAITAQVNTQYANGIKPMMVYLP